MLLGELVQTSERVAQSSGRLDKISALAECLRRLSPEETAIGVAFLSGELRQGRIGIGWAAVRAASGVTSESSTLTLAEVDIAFERIARASGKGSATERARLLSGLFARATAAEQDFLRRLLAGELRQGAQQGLLLDAIARAASVAASDVRRAVMLSGDVGHVALSALSGAGLDSYRLELLRPVAPMLAQTAEDAPDAIARLGRAGLEYKLDGARIQVHRAGRDVRIFTRGMLDATARAPEIVEAVLALPVSTLVLDGEAIVLRPDGKPQPFQTTMRRFGRRLDIDAMRQSLPLTPFFFDCLHADGQDLFDEPAEMRLRTLAELVPPAHVIPRRVTENPDEVRAFADEALAHGHEGIMAKSLVAPYEAGQRGASWLKLKPAHTLDLVVIGVEWGNGRRRGWLSNLHLGARDPQTGSFVMLGKTFKGMTDEMLKWQTARLLELEIARDGHVVYVRPELVVEVSFDGVQTSPHYPGGLALRFARVKRYRPDKSPEQSDTIDTVRAIHARSIAIASVEPAS